MAKMVKLGDATNKQLRAFAENVLGISFPNTYIANPDLLGKIRQAYNKDEIPVEDEPEQPARPKAEAGPANPPKREMVIVRIQPTEEAGGAEPVFVSVNGKAMYIPRDEWCEIPAPYLEALKHAVYTKYEALPDGGLSPPRTVPAYPFSVWHEPSEPKEGVRRMTQVKPRQVAA